jgi:hypothetical protein
MKRIVLLVPMIFLLACEMSEEGLQAMRSVGSVPEEPESVFEDPGTDEEASSELDPEVVIEEPGLEPQPGPMLPDELNPNPELMGSVICYENSNFDSCHTTVSKNNLSTPGEFVYPSSSAWQYRAPDRFIDLTQLGTDEYITENFKRSEYMQLFKGRYGLLAPQMAYRVQRMRNQLGRALSINSGFRGPAYNASIGGARLSRHMYGDAIDFKVTGKSPASLRAYCEEQGASYIQVYRSHIHCDWRNVSLAPELFPAGLNPSQVLSKAQMHNHNHDSHMEFYGQFEIIESSGDQGERRFSIAVDELEDGGSELWTEWQVVKNNEIVFESTEAELILPPEPGQYVIQVKVGGYWSKYVNFTQE